MAIKSKAETMICHIKRNRDKKKQKQKQKKEKYTKNRDNTYRQVTHKCNEINPILCEAYGNCLIRLICIVSHVTNDCKNNGGRLFYPLPQYVAAMNDFRHMSREQKENSFINMQENDVLKISFKDYCLYLLRLIVSANQVSSLIFDDNIPCMPLKRENQFAYPGFSYVLSNMS